MKLQKLLTLAVITAGIFLSISGQKIYAAEIPGIISDNGVNVRANNSLDAIIIDKFDKDNPVTVLGYDGEWTKVQYQEDCAYIHGDYVTINQTKASISMDRVNVRELPSVDSKVLGQFNSGDEVMVTATGVNWYVIKYNGNTAYVYSDFISGDYINLVKKVTLAETSAQKSADSLYAVVTSNTGLRLRKSDNTDSEILLTIPHNDVMDVLYTQGDWTKVSIDDLVGYVSTEFIVVKKGEKPSRNGYSSKAQELLAYAKACLGNRYVWGGTSLKTGADCSGYVQSLMKKIGVTVGRTSRDQARNGNSVSKADLRPGDLVFFGKPSYISHVGIYIGVGASGKRQFIHSSDSKTGVIISNLESRGDYVTARRVIF